MNLRRFDKINLSIFFAIILLSISFFYSCKSEKFKKGDLVIINGLIYKAGSNAPFTGKERAIVKNKIMEYDVVNGKKSGEFKISYLDGKPEMIGNMVDNSNEGLWKYFYPNSQVESEGNFKNNMVDGKWTWYYDNGILKEEGNFVKGKREGKWISYGKEGNISEQKIFKNGEEVNDKP